MKNKISTMLLTMLLVLAGVVVSTLTAPAYAQTTVPMPPAPTLDPKSIPKFVDQLIIPPVFKPVAMMPDPYNPGQMIPYYEVDVTEFTEQILPTVDAKGKATGFGPTTVWGYGGQVYKNPITGLPGYFAYSPGATFEVTRGTPIMVKWINNLNASGQMLSHLFPVDPTIHWADPKNLGMMMGPFPATPPPFPPGFDNGIAQTPIPIVTHLHGGEVPSGSDGGPEQWFTQNGIHGNDYRTVIPTDLNAAVYYYPNEQLPTTLWYHDHALGITRINVMSGLAGFYLLRDPNDPVASSLPKGAYEIPLAIQDRAFLAKNPTGNNEFWYDAIGVDPTVHPYWVPEFFGNAIMVNGKMWPNLNVEPTTYRFRLLDGSNARFYSLFFVDRVTKAVLPFTQIGTDGGYLGAPVPLTSLTIAPGERADIIVDFSGLPVGTKIIMRNNAKAPFPRGTPPDGSTTGQIMQFTVVAPTLTTPPPAQLISWPITIPALVPDTTPKQLTLIEVMGPNMVPAQLLLDGQAWDADPSEVTQVGSTVDWIIINPTADTHPIHLHLVQFQLVSRQKFDVTGYMAEWMKNNGVPMITNKYMPLTHTTVNVANLAMYLKGPVMPPPPNEMGWKDTIQMNPGEVTIIRVRYAPQDAPTTGPGTPIPGVNLYPFDPWVGPGYVWHCHILEHEDNEMMRRQLVTA